MGRVPWLLGLHVLTLLCNLSLIHGQCTQFEFPSINNDNRLAIKPSARLLLHFELDIENCLFNGTDHVIITVSNQDKKNDIFNDVCKILIHPNGTCYSFRPEECECGASGQFYLNKTMNASDETLWKWKVGEETIAPERKIQFVIQKYAPAVKQLTFHSTTDNASLAQPLEPSTSVDIICNYDKGYPGASPAILKYSKGTQQVAPQKDGNEEIATVQLTLPNVSCDNMGEVSCEVAGASENLTKTLLVKCPPVLTAKESPFVSHSGRPTDLRFDLSSYNKTLTGCWITKVSQGHNEGHEEHGEKTRSFANNYKILDSPPNLTLLLSLDEVKEKDVGEWNLTVANDAGTDDVTFELKIEILPQVIQLSLDNSTSSQTVEVKSSVDILCAYRKGDHPNAEVILRMATGTKLTAEIPAADQHRNNKIEARYTMESVGCEDSGEISCELPKAWRNATATLLVKCPPRYTEVVKIFPGIEGNPMKLRFQLITHTQEISGCHVTKVSQGHHEDLEHNKTHTDEASGAAEFQECRQFASGYKILGTLPLGTLEMKLDRLSQDHNGTWRVTISNEAGSASFNFKLEITKAKQSASNNAYVAGVVIAVIIIVIAVVVIVVMLIPIARHTPILIPSQPRCSSLIRNPTNEGDKKFFRRLFLERDSSRPDQDTPLPSCRMTEAVSAALIALIVARRLQACTTQVVTIRTKEVPIPLKGRNVASCSSICDRTSRMPPAIGSHCQQGSSLEDASLLL